MMDARAALVGARAALVTPLWLGGRRWRKLLDGDGAATSGRAGNSSPERATRVALRALAGLSRLPGGGWLNTCLYRSVAECLVLRRYGVEARLRIGVGREHDGEDGIVAHAWVLRPGQVDHAADPRAGALRILDGGA
jgi:hypothetical protein